MPSRYTLVTCCFPLALVHGGAVWFGRGTFRVYTAGSEGPVVFCIHGGGYTGLTWSLMAAHLKDK
jgi:hypothetical protein